MAEVKHAVGSCTNSTGTEMKEAKG